MKQNYIFVFILLITLSIVNAIPHQLYKRKTIFAPCPTGSPNIIDVDVQPDPPPTTGTIIITVSGTLKTGIISAGSQLVSEPIDENGNGIAPPLIDDLCSLDGADCPTDYFSVKQLVDITNITPIYSIKVQIIDAYGQILACSIGTVTGNY